MKTLFKCLYGSHLYGVAQPTSDKDFKGVFTQSLDELVSLAPTNIQWKDEEKNEEHEMYYIKAFADLMASGQTVAYSMLFAPQNMWLESTPEWEELVLNKDKVVSKALKPFVGYARDQAVKYSLKGEKLQLLDEVIFFLSGYPPNFLPRLCWDQLTVAFTGRPTVRFWTDVKGEVETRLMEICGKSFGETTTVKLWLDALVKLRKTYGTRAMEAKENDGKDLKALYHTVRIISEMNEILEYGTVTYPRPEKELLLDIRNGKLTNGEVSNLIDELMAKGDRLFETSTLREKPDYEWLNQWYKNTQINAVRHEILKVKNKEQSCTNFLMSWVKKLGSLLKSFFGL